MFIPDTFKATLLLLADEILVARPLTRFAYLVLDEGPGTIPETILVSGRTASAREELARPVQTRRF